LWFEEFSSTPERDEEEKLTELAPSLLVLTARDRASPEVLEGISEVKVECRGSAEVMCGYVPSPRPVSGTTVPEPDDPSVSIAEVPIAGVVTRVPD
jgi:hypothetical protein